MKQQKDEALIAAAQANPLNFEKVYKKYAPRIFNYFWYRVGHDREVAEDLMQETFVRAFKALPRYQERGYSYHTYLRTIAHNILVNFYRSSKADSLEEVEQIPTEPIRDISNQLDAKLVWQAVQDDLTKTEQNAVLLRYRQDLPVKEIAHITASTANAVKLQLSRARKKLRNDARLAALSEFKDVKKPYTKPRFLKIVK